MASFVGRMSENERVVKKSGSGEREKELHTLVAHWEE
jgi:hypothetical protein